MLYGTQIDIKNSPWASEMQQNTRKQTRTLGTIDIDTYKRVEVELFQDGRSHPAPCPFHR